MLEEGGGGSRSHSQSLFGGNGGKGPQKVQHGGLGILCH